MNTKLLVGLAIVALGIVAGWYFIQSESFSLPGVQTKPSVVPTTVQSEPTTQEVNSFTSPGAETGTNENVEKGGVIVSTTITYTDTGFSPSVVTVKPGTTVSFVNQSKGGMWVASDVHPTHQLLPGFDQLKSTGTGTSYSYVFTKVGTWRFHNHMNASVTGTVVVKE